MRRLLIAVVAVLLSFGVMGTTHAQADPNVCAPGSILSVVEQNAGGELGAQGAAVFGFFNTLDGLVMSRVNHTDVIC